MQIHFCCLLFLYDGYMLYFVFLVCMTYANGFSKTVIWDYINRSFTKYDPFIFFSKFCTKIVLHNLWHILFFCFVLYTQMAFKNCKLKLLNLVVYKSRTLIVLFHHYLYFRFLHSNITFVKNFAQKLLFWGIANVHTEYDYAALQKLCPGN